MEKRFFYLLGISLIVSLLSFSCGKSAEFSSIAKKEYTIEPFTKIEIGGPFNVYIRQGDKEQVYVEADENIINKIRVNNKNEFLVIETEHISSGVKKLNVYVTVVDLTYMKFYDAGNVECKGTLKFQNLEIDYSRTGNMNLNFSCTDLILNSKGTGNIELKGQANQAKISHSGIGNFNSRQLIVDTLRISVAGIGNTEVFATKEIYINASGVGNLSYYGDAVVKEYNVSGVGNVSKH